jgi:phosphoglycolate phosphatase
MTPRHALLVDLDGTLTDNLDGIARSIRHALRALGAPEPTDSALRPCVGPPLRTSLARLLGTADAAPVERALALYRERYAEVGWRENTVYEGADTAFARLAERGETLYLCTSKPAPYAEKIVAHFGFGRFLRRVYGADLAGGLDDKSALVAHLVAREGLDARRCTMIGDREHDVRAAHANGMRAIGVLWGYGSRTELAAADALVADPDAIAPALDWLRTVGDQKSVWP